MLAEIRKETGITLGFGLYGMKILKTEEALLILAEIVFDSIKFTVWEGWYAAPDDLSKSHMKDTLWSPRLTQP